MTVLYTLHMRVISLSEVRDTLSSAMVYLAAGECRREVGIQLGWEKKERRLRLRRWRSLAVGLAGMVARSTGRERKKKKALRVQPCWSVRMEDLYGASVRQWTGEHLQVRYVLQCFGSLGGGGGDGHVEKLGTPGFPASQGRCRRFRLDSHGRTDVRAQTRHPRVFSRVVLV